MGRIRLGNKGRWEYLRAIYERYRLAGRAGKNVILSECCANTGYHRKYAIRLLNGPRPEQRQKAGHRRRRQSYGPEMAGILTAVWEAAGYPWSVRLKAILPAWMPWIRKRFGVRPEIAKQLLKISARQMDRRLRAQKTQRRRRIYGRTKPGYLLKHQIPVKTDSWDVRVPGFTEVDLVSHSRRVGHPILRKFLFDDAGMRREYHFRNSPGCEEMRVPYPFCKKGWVAPFRCQESSNVTTEKSACASSPSVVTNAGRSWGREHWRCSRAWRDRMQEKAAQIAANWRGSQGRRRDWREERRLLPDARVAEGSMGFMGFTSLHLVA